MTKNPNPKNPKNYSCENCDFNTCNRKDYNRHLSTGKHNILKNPNIKTQENNYTCGCGKIYKHQSSLCSHKKKCNTKEGSQEKSPIISQEMVMEILKQNDDLKKILMEQNKQMM